MIRASQNCETEPVIIALTANAFQETRAQVLDIGCNDFVSKPFQAHDVFETIARHLNIRYLYQQSPSDEPSCPSVPPSHTLTATALSSQLPTALIQQLHDAAISLDETQMLNLITQVEDVDLKTAIDNLVQSFQFDKLAQLTTVSHTEHS